MRAMPTPLERILRHRSERPALVDADGVTTYDTLATRSAHIAEELAGRGVRRGDTVALFMEPCAELVAAILALWRLGAAGSVLSPLHKPRERQELLAEVRAALVITSGHLAHSAREGAGGLRVEPLSTALGACAIADAEPALPAAARADDAALLVPTSGTTSRPKAVVLRHRHVLAQCDAIARAWRVGPSDVLVHALPLHHVHGLLIALLTGLVAGATVRLLPRFQAVDVLEASQSATLFMGVPTMYARLVDTLDDAAPLEAARWANGLRRLRLCTCGSAALPARVAERWTRWVGRPPVERFGMTELGVALSHPIDAPPRPGTVGVPLEGVRVRVVDDVGATGGGGADATEGELWVAGPTVFDGYFERPAETAAAFVEEGGERWFRTGDIVRVEDGVVTILGRSSVDILKSAGYKLSAIEIEEALRRHPSVADAAVVGLPDEVYGQRVAAAVVPRAGTILDAEAVTAFARAELAPYKVPRLVQIVPDLPRTAMGKVVKPEVARRLLAGEW
jgi:malonyl-CoA/methylmalonyl-CoA synthetase